MFGSVTAADLHDKLTAAGFTIDRKRILLHTPVKTLGKHTVKVKLHSDVTVELPFDIVSENPIEPSAEKAAEEKKNRKRARPGDKCSRPSDTLCQGRPDGGSRPAL